MCEMLYYLLYSFVMVISLIIIWHRLLGKKIDFKSEKLYISLISLVIITTLNYLLVDKFVKITLLTIIFMFFFKYLFNEDIKTCIITPIYYQFIIMISEGICILFFVSIFKLNLEELKNQYLATFAVNIGTSTISILLSFVPFIKKIYNHIEQNIKRINQRFFLTLLIFVIGFANVFAMITYYQVDIRIMVILNIVYTLFCFFIVLYSFKIQSNYKKVSNKYNIAISSLNDYESMMTKYRIENHENKNLLLTIRAMILNKEKDIPKYINSIVEEKYGDNEKLLKQMQIIPSGGLRATIYSEILKIENHKLNYSLNIDSNVKSVDFIELNTDEIIDVCKIIGVFVDNAIESAINTKEKEIGIFLFILDDMFNIKVSNSYIGKINVDKIFKEGYTTKGANHGYGLSMVKKILESNKNLCNRVELSERIFSQILSIKYKKI